MLGFHIDFLAIPIVILFITYIIIVGKIWGTVMILQVGLKVCGMNLNLKWEKFMKQ